MKCPHCSSDTVVEEDDKVLCMTCGLVLNDSPLKTGTECSSHSEAVEYGYALSKSFKPDGPSPYMRYVPHLHQMTYFPRIRRCRQLVHSICTQLSLPNLIEIQASHMVRLLLGNLKPEDKPPIMASLVEMVALVFLTVRINRSVIVPLKELSVCHFFFHHFSIRTVFTLLSSFLSRTYSMFILDTLFILCIL